MRRSKQTALSQLKFSKPKDGKVTVSVNVEYEIDFFNRFTNENDHLSLNKWDDKPLRSLNAFLLSKIADSIFESGGDVEAKLVHFNSAVVSDELKNSFEAYAKQYFELLDKQADDDKKARIEKLKAEIEAIEGAE